MRDENLHIRVEPEVKRMLQVVAKAEGRTMSDMVVRLITEAYDKACEKHL